LRLEEATVLTKEDVGDAVRQVMESTAAAAAPAAAPAPKGDTRGIAWIPPRYYLG
jgi:hypothetical protein